MYRPNDATQVFFMGIGDAYLGLVDLLSRNGQLLLNLIEFLTDSLRNYHGRNIEARAHHRVRSRVCHLICETYQYRRRHWAMVSSSMSATTPHTSRTSADLTPFSTPKSSSSTATTPSTAIRQRSCAKSWATFNSQIGIHWTTCWSAIDRRCKICSWRRRASTRRTLRLRLPTRTSKRP
jgi:hypothetical protein